jgi:hypothetical protein
MKRPVVVLAIAAIVASACTGVGVEGAVGPNRGNEQTSGGGNNQPTIDSTLVGRWVRVLIFYDAFGPTNTAETTWQFYGDGVATKTLVTRDFISGFYDVNALTTRWKTIGTNLEITYTPPAGGTFSYPFRVAGDSLYFAGEGYKRVR